MPQYKQKERQYKVTVKLDDGERWWPIMATDKLDAKRKALQELKVFRRGESSILDIRIWSEFF